MIKSNGGIIGPDNVTTGGAFGSASGVFKLGEVTNLIKESKWPTAGPQGFQVANSYRSGVDNQYLVRNKTTPTSVTDFTFSVWVKRSKIADKSCILSAWGGDGNNTGSIFFTDGDKLTFEGQTGGSYSANGGVRKITTQLFRDVSGWSHLVFQKDDGVFKIYHNGTEITAFDTNTQSSGTNIFNNATGNVTVGNENTSASDHDFQGYIAEAVFTDGTALAPTSFGEFNSQTGIWVPKAITGLTFGNNGFYLDFKDGSAMGNNASGGTDFSLTNVTSLDQSTDTCTTNFATANSIGAQRIGGGSVRPTAYSEGNLRVVLGSSQYYTRATSTIAVPVGKWYWETKMISNCDSSADPTIGIIGTDGMQSSQTGTSPNSSMQYRYNGQKGYNNVGNASYGATWTNGDIIGIALDLTSATKTITFYKNGTTQGVAFSGDGTSDGFNPASQYWSAFWVAGGSNNATMDINMGSPAYAISSGNTDGNGFGNFEYAPPTGFLSLNTKNLAAVLA